MVLLPEPEARFSGAGNCAWLGVSVGARFFLASRRLFPHLRENYGVITERYAEILAAIPYPDQEDNE